MCGVCACQQEHGELADIQCVNGESFNCQSEPNETKTQAKTPIKPVWREMRRGGKVKSIHRKFCIYSHDFYNFFS